MVSRGRGFHQCRQMAQTITLPMATKRTGSNHLSKSCWNVKGVFAGGAFATVFLDGVVFIWSTRLSAGLPPDTYRAEWKMFASLDSTLRPRLSQAYKFPEILKRFIYGVVEFRRVTVLDLAWWSCAWVQKTEINAGRVRAMGSLLR